MRYLLIAICCFIGIISAFIYEKFLRNKKQKERENKRKNFRLVKNKKY